MIDFILPIVACLIALATPKGQYKTINEILAILFVFIFGIESIGVDANTPVYDGAWFDTTMAVLYLFAGIAFFVVCGFVQAVLAGVGVIASLYFLGANLLENDLSLFFYTEPGGISYYKAMITLNIIQLLAAFRGMLWAILTRMTHGGYNGCRSNHDNLWHRLMHWGRP